VSDLTTAKEIRLDRIVPDPTQPRRTFDENRMRELVTSIEAEGVLQPIVVRYDEADDIYVIVHGERRWRASREARLTAIPAIVREVSGERLLVHQLMENIVREDLNAVDRAAALRALKTQMGDAGWEDVAAAVGLKRSRLFQLLGTEKLHESIQEDIRSGRLSEKQSRALQGLTPNAQLALRDAIVADGLTALQATQLARMIKAATFEDTPAGAALKVDELRISVTGKAQSAPEIDAIGLLDLIRKATSGNAADRAELAAAAQADLAAPFDQERLAEQVHGLARTLSRIPVTQLKPGTASFGHLRALQRTLDTLLD
jgi:ParB family chromosome partitioning protein